MDGTSFELSQYKKKTIYTTGQDKIQVQFSRASKFCSWADANGSLVIQWASKIILSCHVSDNFRSITISKLMTAG